MSSERNDPPLGAKPAGTPLEPTSATSSASASAAAGRPDAAKNDSPKSDAPKSDAAKAAAAKAGESPSKSSVPSSPAKPAGAAPAAGSSAATAAAPRRGLGLAGVAIVALVVSIVVALALIATAPRWTPLVPGLARDVPPAAATGSAQPDPRIAELAARIEQLASRPSPAPASESVGADVAGLREELARLAGAQKATADALAKIESSGAAAGASVDTDAIVGRLAKLEQEFAGTSPALERARSLRGEMDALIAELGKVGERDAKIEAQVDALGKAVTEQRNVDARAADAARAAAIVALGARLRQAVSQGQDAAPDLAALKNFAGSDSELTAAMTALAPASGKALATQDRLRQRFPAVARDIVAADAGDQAGTWWEKALARLQNLVSVRRTGPGIEGETAEARVAQAEAALDAGRLDQAVAALKPLTGQAAREAAPWLADAEALLAAQAAADRIVARGAALLAQHTAAPPAATR